MKTLISDIVFSAVVLVAMATTAKLAMVVFNHI